MAKENRVVEKAEEGVSPGEMVSPLSYQGRGGGNPLSPEAEEPEPFTPRDPLGILPKDAKGRGKTGPGY